MIALAQQPAPPSHLLETVSASRLKCWLQCRLKFFFRYVQQVRKPSTPALFVGKAVHALLQKWNLARWHGVTMDRSALESEFQHLFTRDQLGQAIAWNGKEAEARSTAWAVIEAYLDQTSIPADEKPQGVEVRLELDLAQHGLPVLVGVLDLVRPGGRIVDFKTSAQTPHDGQAIHQNELQLSCYGLLYRDATGETEGGFELHHLVKLKTPKVVISAAPPMTAAQETKLFRILESYVEGVERRDFVPSPSLGCVSCEYFSECRNWSGR